jgi:hypothetical protein
MEQWSYGVMELWSYGVMECCAFSGLPCKRGVEGAFPPSSLSRNYGGQAGRLPRALPLGCSRALFLNETDAKLSQP